MVKGGCHWAPVTKTDCFMSHIGKPYFIRVSQLMVNYHKKYKHSTMEVELGNAVHFQMGDLKSRQYFE